MLIPFGNDRHQAFGQMRIVGKISHTKPLTLFNGEPLLNVIHPRTGGKWNTNCGFPTAGYLGQSLSAIGREDDTAKIFAYAKSESPLYKGLNNTNPNILLPAECSAPAESQTS